MLLPGVYAGYIPWRFFGLAQVNISVSDPFHLVGTVCIATGSGFLVACIWEFARRGRGTLVPIDPTQELVVSGLYRYVRNPMYLSVTVILLGELLLTGSSWLAIYWAVWFAAVNVFIVAYEEPALRRRFGASYENYTRSVRRWIPVFPARRARRD